MPLVTLSAAYGAGGAWLGPRLAERLGVPFLDRAIPTAVARELAVPLERARAHDQSAGSAISRFALRLTPMALVFGAAAATPHDPIDEEAYRRATEHAIRTQAATGDGVILGRAGALVLADAPRALHIRLDGPREARLEQAMRLRSLDRDTAERELRETDLAREAYVRHFYGADAHDSALYHLTLDTTALPLGAVLKLLALAAAAR